MANPILVEVTRGPLVESVHRGSVAVCDAEGVLRMAFGDVESAVYPRSSLKPLQTVPLIASGAADAFGTGDAEIALACASHSAEPAHTEGVAAWLARIGAGADELACGPHLPLHEETARAMIAAGQAPTRVHNNCSGKHTGFLTLARHLNAPASGYTDPSHPVQRAVVDVISRFCAVDAEMPCGIDGCAAPNFALPLRALARGMARLATGAGLGQADRRAAARIVSAMISHPHLVSGSGRFDFVFGAALGGRAVTKAGAEGVQIAILPEAGLGVALKIDDGAGRAADTAMAAVLTRLGIASSDHPAARRYLEAPVCNTRGDIAGAIRPAPVLSA